jgi:hypothetical protein
VVAGGGSGVSVLSTTRRSAGRSFGAGCSVVVSDVAGAAVGTLERVGAGEASMGRRGVGASAWLGPSSSGPTIICNSNSGGMASKNNCIPGAGGWETPQMAAMGKWQ